MPVRSLLDKRLFIGLERTVQLCAGGETPALRSHAEAAARFFRDKSDAMPGRVRMAEVHARCKEQVSALIGLPASDIGFFLNSSDAVATALAAVDLGGGDNVVVARGDFNSLTLNAALSARRTGAQLRLAGTEMVFDEDEIAAAADRRTKAIVVSHVSHLSGRRCDLRTLRNIADGVGARLIVDCAHALGAVPVDGSLCDALVSCTYKWQLGVHGCAVFAVNSARWPEMEARTIGWHAVEFVDDWRNSDAIDVRSDAGRFEAGNPPFLALYLLNNGLSHLLRHDADARETHIVELSGRIRDAIADRGIEVLTPSDRARRAGNIAFAADNPLAIVSALRRNGVFVWGGEGRVRVSAHIYNDADDVRALCGALDGIGRDLLPRN